MRALKNEKRRPWVVDAGGGRAIDYKKTRGRRTSDGKKKKGKINQECMERRKIRKSSFQYSEKGLSYQTAEMLTYLRLWRRRHQQKLNHS